MVKTASGNPQPPAATSLRRYLARRALLWLLVVAVAVVGIVVGNIWWQERPLDKAEALLEAGDTRGAISLVNRFLREHREHGRAQAIKARALVAAGEPAAAIELFERVGAQNATEIHAWARALVQQQQWSAAAPLLENVLQAGIHRADVLVELAACRTQLGDYAGAEAVAREYAGIPEFQARGQVLLGAIHREKDDLPRACAAWDRVLALQPDATGLQIPAAEFLRELGRVKLATGDPLRAVELLERSRQLAVQADTLVALGEAYSQSGRSDAAADAWRQAVDADPSHRLARLSLAKMALGGRDAHAALEWLRPLEADQGVQSDAAFALQRAYVLLGDDDSSRKWKDRGDALQKLEEADKAADRLLRDKPESPWAPVIRAYRFAEAGNWIEAERILKPILPLAPQHAFVAELNHAIHTRGNLPALASVVED